ncbi:hypothetical protein O7623_13225 [Solwaraspora sp. WMMD791]|uniref:hypothetical protein n=1 Tax=Solwaraspora sp. WMMD791 TaxID=3016086 RepID=UPI00249CECC4|nr:hypothetical protein [Solwaraspora sp. WMMD791]WFE30081.1 hypothetical protein O7623_13225 [Solwaraspora sp. WMMD791]
MRDDPTPDPQPDPERLAAHADAIRAAAAELLTRVTEWRNSPHWQDTPTNHHRYHTTVGACTQLDSLPDPTTPEHLADMAATVRPACGVWRPTRPGPQQAIHAAAERLSATVVRSSMSDRPRMP